MREREQRADRIEQTERRPRPGRDHDQIAEREGRQEQQQRPDKKPCGIRRRDRLRQVQRDRDRHIEQQQEGQRALSERGAEQQPEQQQMQQARPRQVAGRPQQKIERAHHRGGERNVLGVVEHRAEPRAADRERDVREKTGARARDQPRGGPDRGDAANADQRAEQVPDRENVERQDAAEQDRGDVEQPAVEIEVLVGEDGAVGRIRWRNRTGSIRRSGAEPLRRSILRNRETSAARAASSTARQQPCRDIERVVSRPARPGMRPRMLLSWSGPAWLHRESCLHCGRRAPDFTCGMSAERPFHRAPRPQAASGLMAKVLLLNSLAQPRRLH